MPNPIGGQIKIVCKKLIMITWMLCKYYFQKMPNLYYNFYIIIIFIWCISLSFCNAPTFINTMKPYYYAFMLNWKWKIL